MGIPVLVRRHLKIETAPKFVHITMSLVVTYMNILKGSGFENTTATTGPTTVRVTLTTIGPGRCGCNLKSLILKLISRMDIYILSISCEIALMWMPQDLTDQSSTVKLLAWCRQAASHYLSQSWLSFMLPYGVVRL